MIKNYEQWNGQLNEKGFFRNILKTLRGVGKTAAKETLDQVIDNASKAVKSIKELADSAAKSANMAKETLSNIPDDAAYDTIRKKVADSIKSADDVKKMADEASSKLDDAIKSGDPEKIKEARKFAEDTAKTARKTSSDANSYAKGAAKDASRKFSSRFGREEGTDMADDTFNTINDSGGDKGKSIKNNARKIKEEGESSFLRVARTTGKIILWPIKTIGTVISTAVIIGAGAVVWNLIKGNKQNEAIDKVKAAHNEMEKKLWEEGGVSYTEIDIKKSSFSEFFTIFFAGDEEALPQKDANELKVMLKGDVTVRDFYAKLAQMCFEYTGRYFKDFEKSLIASSNFYSYMLDLEKEIGINKIIVAIDQAEGKASKTLLDTFSEDGEPKIISDLPLDYSNPNIKILIGGNEPVKVGDLIEEAKEFLLMMATLRKKINNDSIESIVGEAIDQNSTFSKEEFDYKAQEITEELRGQLSKKEEVFVAIVGLILAYNKELYPFNSIYKFDTDELYSTAEGIEDIVDESFALDTYNQLGRIYLSLSADSNKIFSAMGKESTLFGVMEYSYFGNVMKSIILLYAVENICKMILSQKGEVKTSAEFTSSEIKEYQTILNQIQRKEGVKPTVTLTSKLDDETQEALKVYQKKLNLPETGLPGDISLPKLRNYLVSLIITN
jgi:hypothetical protein